MRRGKAARSSHLFPAAVGSGWNWHLVIEDRASTGCRGFIGPVPQPLLMRFVISTNTDRMIYRAGGVNSFFSRLARVFFNSITPKLQHSASEFLCGIKRFFAAFCRL